MFAQGTNTPPTCRHLCLCVWTVWHAACSGHQHHIASHRMRKATHSSWQLSVTGHTIWLIKAETLRARESGLVRGRAGSIQLVSVLHLLGHRCPPSCNMKQKPEIATSTAPMYSGTSKASSANICQNSQGAAAVMQDEQAFRRYLAVQLLVPRCLVALIELVFFR